MRKQVMVPAEELAVQQQYTTLCREELAFRYDHTPKAFVHTFGCQQNVDDGEKLCGMMREMGFCFTDHIEDADLILYNTCAIRENAEQKVFGVAGQAIHLKATKKDLLIGLCGCMMQQPHITDKIRHSYPGVDFVMGTHVLHRFPEILYGVLKSLHAGKRKRAFETPCSDGVIAEGLPIQRKETFRAAISIMYGCNNFCTYCVVPLVRGRERSRRSADILKEAKELIAAGCREITLLGQNVNSYGKDLEDDLSFPELLEAVNALPGDFWIRFMTSHPRDCTDELIHTIARCEKVCRHIHLPVQAGNNRVLKAMNRHYTREKYLSIIAEARRCIPDVNFTSDIIVGFPGETEEEFNETLSLIKEVRFSSLFTFIFSPREGTKAAKMDDPVPAAEKSRWFNELLEAQREIGLPQYAEAVGKTFRVLVEGEGKERPEGLPGRAPEEGEIVLMARNEYNMVIDFYGPRSLIGNFAQVSITSSGGWALTGELAK